MRKTLPAKHSMNAVYLTLTAVLALLIYGGFFFKADTSVKPVELSLEIESTKSGTVTRVYAQAPYTMNIRGYYIPLTFSDSKAQITKITYKLGTVSEDLGSDNRSLRAVNESRSLLLQGESHDKEGLRMKSRDTEVAAIEARGKAGLEVDPTKGMFYMIDDKNSLIEVPVRLR